MSRHTVPSAPTFDEYENPDAILKVKPTATPPPLYDEVVQEDEEEKQFVRDDVERARAVKKKGCKSRTMICFKVGLTLMLVTTFVLTFFATYSLVSIRRSHSMYWDMSRDIGQLKNDRHEMLTDISRIESEVGKISETVYSHHTTTTTTTQPRRRYSYNNNWGNYYYDWKRK